MAHPQETRDNVRALFIEGLPLAGAAIAASVSYDTARDWKKSAKRRGDDWDAARAAYCISESGIDDLNQEMAVAFARQSVLTMRELDKETISAIDKVTLQAQLADSYVKFSKGFSRINPKFSGLSISLDTLKTIVEYLRKNDPAALQAFHTHIEPIGAILGKRHAK